MSLILMTVRSSLSNWLKELPNVWSCTSDADHKEPLVALSWCEILLSDVYNIERWYFIRKHGFNEFVQKKLINALQSPQG